jgi:hypothetical protein
LIELSHHCRVRLCISAILTLFIQLRYPAQAVVESLILQIKEFTVEGVALPNILIINMLLHILQTAISEYLLVIDNVSNRRLYFVHSFVVPYGHFLLGILKVLICIDLFVDSSH